VSDDQRGWRIALLPEALLNPRRRTRASLPEVLAVLESSGYGVLHLPPAGRHGLLLAVIADQVAEYAHHGYAVVAIGLRARQGDGLHWRRLTALLRHRGVAPPPRHVIRTEVDAAIETQRLTDFLSGYDLPAQERRRWRV
jgi:hypothetical protein